MHTEECLEDEFSILSYEVQTVIYRTLPGQMCDYSEI